jgi:histidinol-phosphate aminotransferase
VTGTGTGTDAVAGPSGAGPVPIRPDLRALAGYHSPQVEVTVRLNTNESPLPPPEAWLQELRQALGTIAFNRYPDRDATELRAALADHHGVDPAQVFCATGSNEVLQCLLLAYGGAGRRVATLEPSYTLHRHIAEVTATEVVSARRGADFAVDVDAAEALVAGADPVITFICSPNNPTGGAEPPATVTRLLAASAGLVVVDEAYGQFAPTTALDLVRARVPGAERLVVVRTFSKTWSMAAFRLGYLVADPAVVAACELVALPYHVDAVSQTAGRLALRHVADMEARVRMLVDERQRVQRALADLPVTWWPSDANFVLLRPEGRSATEVWEGLLARSVLIRDCSSWSGLQGCLRVTIGTPAENDAFLAALQEVLAP